MLALVNYGHFTAMRARAGAVQGLDLHLQRLREGHRALFDVDLDEPELRRLLRLALDGQGQVSLRITGFARAFDYRDPLKRVQPEWLISVAAPATVAATGPLRLQSFHFVRPLPQIKHVATLPLFHYRRQAHLVGCDDALFVDGPGPQALVVEGSVWNLGCWDGTDVWWPQGPALRGTCERLLQRGFEAMGVAQRYAGISLEKAQSLAAFTANANGCMSVASIDGRALPQSEDLPALLARALDTQAWERI